VKEDTLHNPELQLAFDFVQYTDEHIFLTGRAGTGKTTFLHSLKELSPKRMIVVAPTGVAALNAGGVTIHSFFQLPFGPRVPGYKEDEERRGMRFSGQKRNIIRSLDLLIIDEISMVRADLLDSIDERLRTFRRNNQPFGGVQLLMIGDMQQLPPVVKGDEWELLRKYYKTAFFFSSLALQKTNYRTITLQHVYRQHDQHFINILNKIRDKRMDEQSIALLNQRHKPNFDQGDKNYIILTTHNARAKAINDKKLGELKVKERSFTALVRGNFPEYMFPTEVELELKVGAQVMFVKNDPEPEKRFFNGKIGTITRFDEDEVVVKCPDDEDAIYVRPLEWENVKYTIDEQSKEIKEEVEGTFTQIPLKLAWAITIHKSQGLTFDRAIIDSESAFAHGQVYVALSRCRSLEGLVLSTPFSPFSLKHDRSIEGFNDEVSRNQPDKQELESSKAEFQQKLLVDLFTFSQLQSMTNWLSKLLYDNRNSLQPDAVLPVKTMKEQIKADIIDVSEKFKRQVNQLITKNSNAEQNNELQERIKKAAAYFSGKIKDIVLSGLESFSIETDNKEVRKKIGKAEKRLIEEATFKMVCLQSCSEGFVVKDYLKTRAKASLEEPTKKRAGRKRKLPVSKDISNPELYDLLKKWRDMKSAKQGLPYFMILPIKTMRALSNQVPTSIEELKKAHGFGQKKLDQFGAELLELLIAFKKDHNVIIETPPQSPPSQENPKTETKQLSLELWLKYRDLEKIAEERDFAVSTIEGHLAHFVGLPVTDFVDEDKLEKIAPIFWENNETILSEAREKLGEKYSFSDLKFVRAYVLHRKTFQRPQDLEESGL